MNRDEITADHRARLAYVYIRQSSRHQVRVHQESQRRQRALVEQAVALDWPPENVVEIDEDLGVSASRSSRKRLAFEDMVAEVALGQVGLVLALDVARLCRANSAWYHLMDICAIRSTLIADGDGLYDPKRYNDRLLLGLKGTMSEAELHQMRERLNGALRAKAQRGEFRYRLGAGYLWDEAGRMQKTPDEQVQSVIQLVFERFDQLGSVHQAHLSLVEDGIQVPVQKGPRGHIEWKLPAYRWVHSLLTNPDYAGIYAFGRRQTIETLDAEHRPIKQQHQVEREKWHAFIPDHHEGYITSEHFERNQKRIAANRRAPEAPGAPREGESLLQGLVLCGECGRPMKVGYGRGSRPTVYRCNRARSQMGSGVCQSFGARRVEKAVEQLVLKALEPVGLEAMMRAAELHVEASQSEQTHWQQRIERAQYEAELARRQYDAVDPTHRLVARQLEQRWEKALQETDTIEAEADKRLTSLPQPLSSDEEARLRAYAHELPSLWRAETTRPQDRTEIVRCLIERVVVRVPKQGAKLEVKVHWNGGEVSTVEVERGKPGMHRWIAEDELIDLIRDLAREFSDVQIARILHRRRLRTPKGLTFTAHRVAGLRRVHGIPSGPRLPRQGEDIYTAERAAEILGVTRGTVIRWAEAGLLRGAQSSPGAPWRIQVTEEDQRRLKATDVPAGWLTLKAAAAALRVSQQTVLQRLKSGELQGMRVRTGRRSAWRILLTSTTYDGQSALFQ